jgi:tetratricopeptide (TPR) repeat protein
LSANCLADCIPLLARLAGLVSCLLMLLWGVVASAATGAEDSYLRGLVRLEQGLVQEGIADLRKAIDLDPNHAGARLDLALVHCQRGQASLALPLFEGLLTEPDLSPVLADLIRGQVRNGCPHPPAPASAALGLQVDLGWVSNVNQGLSASEITFAPTAPIERLAIDPASQPISDRMRRLALFASYPAKDSLGGLWSIAGEARAHFRQAQFDSGQLHLARLAATRIGEWSVSLLGWAQRGDRREYAGRFGYESPGLGESWAGLARWSLGAAVSRQVYPGASAFNAVRTEWGPRLYLHGDRADARFSLDRLWEQGRSGQRVGLELRAALPSSLQLLASSRAARLQDANPYNPTFFGPQARETRRVFTTVGLIFPLAQRLPFGQRTVGFLQYTSDRQKDAIPIFSYTNQTVNIGLSIDSAPNGTP